MTKKIVFVIERLSTGGAERVVAALANEICELNDYEVYIVTYHPKEQDEYYVSPRARRIALKKANGGRWGTIYQRYQQLKKVIYEINPYCVFSLAIPKTDAVLLLALKDRKFPLIISERNDEGKREHRIVNFCRIEPQKNLKLAVDAFNLIRKEFPDYTLEFYGDGAQKQELEKYVDSLQLEDRVIFHGYSSCIHEKIINASLFVSTSDYEGISNSMLEAMAIGLPTICTDCPPGGAKSVISDGINGLLVPVRDVEKLAEAMRTVLKNESMQNEMSIKASLLAGALEPSVIAKKWINFADEVRK